MEEETKKLSKSRDDNAIAGHSQVLPFNCHNQSARNDVKTNRKNATAFKFRRLGFLPQQCLFAKSNKQRRVAFTLAEGAPHVAIPNWQRLVAFTLAEVLITLGIIGIVAAMTMPTLIHKQQQKVLKSQFLKTYSTLSQALNKSVVDFGTIPNCYIWDGVKPYPDQICIRWNASKTTCVGWGLPNNQPYPADYSGPQSDCQEFYPIFYNNLKIVKKCKNTEKDGCSEHYKGADTLLKDSNSDLTDQELLDRTAGDNDLRESNFNKLPSVVLADGSIIIEPYGLHPFVDINGKKAPNKWGYDLYRINFRGNPKNGLRFTEQAHPVEKGGKTWNQMRDSCYSK